MELHFTCSSCQKRLKVKGSSMGSQIGCPGCNTPLVVPRSGFAPGTRIAGFEIVRPLGKGGMGEVYLARQLSMGREIALKVLSAEFAAVPGAVERFVKEVHVAAKLEHTHIVAAYDAGQDEGLHYMAMSYVPGCSLAAMLKPGVVLAERDALTMTRQLAQALDYAWSTFRIIHRDIKPANILFDAKGEPKLADMGLSKSLDDAEALTMSGSVMGTPNYMSPEQAEGAGDLDQRADIYSLGATLYHAVTGQMPFAGSSIMAVLRKQAVEILPDPRQFNPQLSEHFVGLLQIMLAKNRDDRYADWKALIHDIDFVLDSKPPSVALPGEGKSVLIRKGPAAFPAGHAPQKKIVIPKEGIHPHPAPAAAPRPKPAMKPRDKALVFGGVAVLGLAVLATVLAVNHSKQRAEQQKLQARSDAQTQARQSAETRDREAQAAKAREQAELWQVAADFAAANPDAYDRAIANFEDVGKRLTGTKYELMAKNEIERIREARTAAVGKALAELETRAKEPADRKDFDAAAEVFAKYQGAFATELAQQRTALEQKYRALAAEAAAKMTEAGRAAKDAERAAIAAAAEAVYAGDLAKAQQACRAFLDDPAIVVDKAEVKRIAGWLDQAAAADKTLLATFEAQKGQTIPLVLDGARAEVRIAGVRGGRIQIEQKKGVGWASAELTTAQIPLDVQHARLKDKLDPAALGLWAGSLMLKANRPDLAAKQFQAAGPLATALLAKTEGAKTGQRETDAQSAFAQVLQAVGLPAAGLQPEAIAERIQPGKVTVAQATAALRHLDAYAAAFGDTQHATSGAALIAALRPALEAAQKGAAPTAPVAPVTAAPKDDMVLIPAGEFQMGDTFGEGEKSELPVHTVSVSAFYMDKYEVTKKLWDDVYEWALKRPAETRYAFENPGQGKEHKHPVHSISWHDAVKWCNARSEKEGLTPCYTVGGAVYRTDQREPDCNWSANGYRLPTEAEWEKAARGGTAGHRFPWADSDTITHKLANYTGTNDCVYDASSTRGYHPKYAVGDKPYTSPVGSFDANGYGLYDMAGNVRELCWDWKGSYPSGSQKDPPGPTSGSFRVGRGGSWYYIAWHCRTAYRFNFDPSYRSINLGFRSVRAPGQ